MVTFWVGLACFLAGAVLYALYAQKAIAAAKNGEAIAKAEVAAVRAKVKSFIDKKL